MVSVHSCRVRPVPGRWLVGTAYNGSAHHINLIRSFAGPVVVMAQRWDREHGAAHGQEVEDIPLSQGSKVHS